MCFSIAIDQPYAPFTHEPGATLRIPGTNREAIIYPGRLEIGEFSFDLPLEERAVDFTALLDLKKGAIFVNVRTKSAYFRYRIKAAAVDEGITVVFDRGLRKRFFIPCVVEKPKSFAWLSTGVYKKQEWESVQKRGNIAEILPIWFMASQWFEEGEMPENLLATFQESFGAIFTPRAARHTGYKGACASFPFKDFQALFAQYGEKSLRLSFPHYLACGRVQNLTVDSDFSLDLLWSNKQLKQAIIRPFVDQTCTLHFPGKSCRLRFNKKDKGRTLLSGETLSFIAKQRLFLDRFTK